MLVIVIILATLLAISAGLHVYQAKQLRKWEGFDETSTQVLGDAMRNANHAQVEAKRWRQRCFATLDRNLWLRTRLEELQVQYDEIFVKYAKQSLNATEVPADEAEILDIDDGDHRDRRLAEEIEHDETCKHGPLTDEENIYLDSVAPVEMDQPISERDIGRKPVLVSPPFVNDVEEIDPEVSIDYYVVDRGE